MAQKQAVQLKLDGKPLSLRRVTPSQIKVKTFLLAAPKDELFSTSQLASLAMVSPNLTRLSQFWDTPELAGFSVRTGSQRYWGNPAAIAEFERQVSRES